MLIKSVLLRKEQRGSTVLLYISLYKLPWVKHKEISVILLHLRTNFSMCKSFRFWHQDKSIFKIFGGKLSIIKSNWSDRISKASPRMVIPVMKNSGEAYKISFSLSINDWASRKLLYFENWRSVGLVKIGPNFRK